MEMFRPSSQQLFSTPVWFPPTITAHQLSFVAGALGVISEAQISAIMKSLGGAF
jgi:hypothetical protein